MDSIALYGSPGSPYTRKMLALLRYRRISYRFLSGGLGQPEGMPRAKVSLLPTFYLPDSQGELEAVVDSTPIIRRLEQEYPGRSVVPSNPVLGFLDLLLEDYADEWLTKAMFHFRWWREEDISHAARILPLFSDVSMEAERHQATSSMVRDRQVGRLYVVGSNDTTCEIIESSYARFLNLLETRLGRVKVLAWRPTGLGGFCSLWAAHAVGLLRPDASSNVSRNLPAGAGLGGDPRRPEWPGARTGGLD